MNGKVLLVTGGGRGIGAQIALGAAKAGWHVAVNYAANADAAATVVEHIEAAGGEAFAVKGDIGSEADVLAMFAAVDARFGRLDGLADRIERLPDRVLLYADDGEAAVAAAHARGLQPETVLVRRSSLEDVFLRLTGRSLAD